MKFLIVIATLLTLTALGAAQRACRQMSSQVVEHKQGFTIFQMRLPSSFGAVSAKAFLPDNDEPSDPAVFSFSALLRSPTKESVDIAPVAAVLAKHGEPTIVLERRLSWPAIAQSVGTMRGATICAEQWLASHVRVRPNHWRFIGPEVDSPDLEQFADLGETANLTFLVKFPVAGGPEDSVNTEHAFRSTSIMLEWLLTPFADEE